MLFIQLYCCIHLIFLHRFPLSLRGRETSINPHSTHTHTHTHTHTTRLTEVKRDHLVQKFSNFFWWCWGWGHGVGMDHSLNKILYGHGNTRIDKRKKQSYFNWGSCLSTWRDSMEPPFQLSIGAIDAVWSFISKGSKWVTVQIVSKTCPQVWCSFKHPPPLTASLCPLWPII